MTDEAPGAALQPQPEVPVRAMEALMNDDEIRRTYRIAEALHGSQAFKDVKSAEVAFAKMVIGRDLGLSPAQAMGGIHLVEGGVQMHYAMLGQFVRARQGYDYRPGWIKQEPVQAPEGREATDAEAAAVVQGEQRLVVVWHDEEDPADMRPIVGAVVDFSVGGKRRGVSRFTLQDARQANLIKDDRRAAWNTAPRNMLLARAMSNGVKWFVPETLGGLPVYVEGELPERKSLTAGTADDSADEGQGIDLGPQVEKLIERATKLGHRGLSNRGAVEVAIGKRSPGVIKEWCVRASAELDRFEAEKAGEGGEPASDTPEEAPVEAPPEEVTAGPEDVQQPEDEDDPHARLSGEVEVAEEQA